MSSSPIPANRKANGNATRHFWIAATIILLLRLVSLWFNNSQLFFDEAQYWVWAKELSFGYFSKPPLLAWTIGLFTSICGDSEFCVRLPSPLLHTFTAFVIFLTAKRMFDPMVALTAGVMWLLLPAVSLSSTLISTDVPLLLFWSLALYFLVRLREGGGWTIAALLALSFGLGLNAKYAMAFFLMCALVYALTSPKGRQILRQPRFIVSMIAGFAFLVPNILWNLSNQFATVSHTGENIGWGGGFPHLDRLAEFVGSQFGVVGPIVFAVYLIGIVRLAREGMSDNQKLLITFSLPVLLLICIQAIMSKAFANWGATAFPALVILVSDLFVNRMPIIWSRVSTTIHAFVFAALAIAVAFAMPGQLPLEGKQNPFERMWGGKELATAISKKLDQHGITHLLSLSRKDSATLIYYLRDDKIDILAWRVTASPTDHFQLSRAFQDQDAQVIRGARFILPVHGDVPAEIARSFATVQKIGDLDLYPGSAKLIDLYLLDDYRGTKP